MLRVGITLPEDGRKRSVVTLSDPDSVQIEFDGMPIEATGRLFTVSAAGQGLTVEVDGHHCEGRMLRLQYDDPGNFYTLDPVIAGRGFHWAKDISVKLPHILEITVVDGSIMAVNELPLETYLACVATSEMSSACPPSYLEAQTLVARSWMLANVEQKHVRLGFDVCNDDCCQRYQGFNNITEQSLRAAENTRGQVLMYGSAICDARYSNSCGGIMESFENLWEGRALPYMKTLPDSPHVFDVDLTRESDAEDWIRSVPECYCGPAFIPEKDLKKYLGHVDEAGEYFRWTLSISNAELSANIRDKLGLDLQAVRALQTRRRGGSGRLLELGILYIDGQGRDMETAVYKDYEARRVLHPKFLYSSAVIIESERGESGIPERFRYRGAGWGHGAGLCQIGGLGMSLAGKDSPSIVMHYYPGSRLEKIY